MLITDRIFDTLDPLVPLYARELDLDWQVSVEIGVGPGMTEPDVLATFLFTVPGVLLGGPRLWHAHIARADAAYDPKALEDLLMNACEQLRTRRHQMLTAPIDLSQIGAPR